MAQQPKDIVRAGYDSLSLLYRKDDDAPQHYLEWIDLITSILPESQPASSLNILDIGCGCGVPTSQKLSEAGYSVTGIDISPVQIQRARKLVPKATFLEADIVSATSDILEPSKFNAIIALYVLIHIPLDEQPKVISRITELLRPGGYCLMTVGIEEWTGQEGGWLGSDESVQMWWSVTDVDTYRRWVNEAGLEIVRDEYVPDRITAGTGHQLLLVKKPS